jgi:hypothetical protein
MMYPLVFVLLHVAMKVHIKCKFYITGGDIMKMITTILILVGLGVHEGR